MNSTHELLHRYTEDGSDEAFRELVRLHANLVYSAALRVTGRPALAEEAVQIVFTSLAQKARRLGGSVILSGWLYRHACHTAAKLVRQDQRRQLREQTAAAMNDLHAASEDAAWREISPVLDSAMARLDPDDRDAIVLRFFERRDFRTVGTALGLSDDAAQKRISRALEKLRGFLAKRGITSTAGALSLVLAAQATAEAPAQLMGTVPGRALALAAAGRRSVWAAVTAGLAAARWKAATAALLAVGAAATMVHQQRRIRDLREENEATRLAAAAKPESGPQAAGRSGSGLASPAALSPAEIVERTARILRGGAQGVSATTEALQLLAGIPVENIESSLGEVAGVSDPGAQKLIYKYLLGRWAEVSPHAALNYSESLLPTMCRDVVSEGILSAWGGRNSEAVISMMTKAGPGELTRHKESLTMALFRAIASRDPARAVDFATRCETEADRAHAFRGIMEATSTPEQRNTLLEILNGIADPALRLQGRRAVVERWAETEAAAAAAWIDSVPDNQERLRLIDSLGLSWLQRDPAAAAAWWMARDASADTMVKIIGVWTHVDAAAAGEWLRNQPAGPDSDLARMTFARQVEDADASSGLQWAETITDAALRESTVSHVFQSWQRREPAAAEEFLQQSGWPEERRSRLAGQPPSKPNN